jgi:hypothetical protein
MDRKLRNTIIFGIMIISLSIAYFLVLKPIKTQRTEFDACYEKCVQVSNNEKACIATCGRHYSNN